MIDATVYDPQDIWGNLIAEFLRRPASPLQRFELDHRGIYALYYKGPHARYTNISSPNALTAIYAGSAKRLGVRLQSHCKTLDEVYDLERADFLCRILPLPGELYLAAEVEFLNRHKPLWNEPEYAGFGNDGSPRVSGKASRWDSTHPGRRRALGRERVPEAALRLETEQAASAARDMAAFEELFGS